MADIAQLKAQIRALLLALGRGATERDFRKEFYENEGQSFNEVLKKLGFHSSRSFFAEIPDVCRTSYTADNELFIQRISNEQTSHMDRLTIAKKRKRPKRFMPVQRYPRTPYQYSAPQRYQQMPPRPPRLATNYYQPQMRPSFGPAGCNNNSRPINNQRVPFPPANRPPTVPQRVQARPTIPIRSTLGSERVVYKKNECIVYDGNNEKAVSVIRPSPPPVAQTVQVNPSLPTVPIHSRLGSERVVYNKSERVIFDGDNEKAVQVKQSDTWTDAETTSNDSLTSSYSSDTVIDVSSDMESLPCEKENIDPNRLENNRKITYDEANDAKIAVTINRTPPPVPPRNPQTIRQDISLLRMNMMRLKMEQSRKEEEKLPLFISSPDYKIPLPQMVNSPKFFLIKILSVDSPEKFTFNYDFDCTQQLYSTMKEFYDSIESTDIYLAKNLAIDLVVAVKHQEKWYRAKIKSFNETSANIIPIDCMTTRPIEINRQNIFHLHKKFANVPQKSAYGRIFGVSPVKGEWSEEATELIRNLKTKRHRATIKMFEDNVYHLSIIINDETRLRVTDEMNQRDLINLDPELFFSPAKEVCMSLEKTLMG